MAAFSFCWDLKLLVLLLLPCLFPCCSSDSLHPLAATSTLVHQSYTGVTNFTVINRRALAQCSSSSPLIKITTQNSPLSDDQYVTVTVTGISDPSDEHWVAMISPSDSDVKSCPLKKAQYVQTGDISHLPLLCHYPVRAQYLKSDPNYLQCKNLSCSATIKFHVVNIRTEIEFVLFDDGFLDPCIMARTSAPLKFANPNSPLNGHISTTDSTATSMRLTWVSGSKEPQQVQYANGKTATSNVTTFTQADMCSSFIPSPAKDFGWHDPGFIHSAVMTGLTPSSKFSYRYGSEKVGWSNQTEFRTPPAGGSNELKFLIFGDMGKAPLDASVEHYIQPGSISVIEAMKDEIKSGNVESIFHIGDISYATGFIVEWDYFLHLIAPIASRVPYMTSIGNHERDYIKSGVVYGTPDSGGECGVPYETYFQMPTAGKDKPWYSIEHGPVHFVVMSTEHDWAIGSEQYQWMRTDMASVNRSKTPWLIFTGHRPVYSSKASNVDKKFVNFVEPLLKEYKVDLVVVGHVHNYERTCSVFRSACFAMPTKDKTGIDVYDHNNYAAPVHAIVGNAGFSLDSFSKNVPEWSLKRILKFGYARVSAKPEELSFELVDSHSRTVEDSFKIIKKKPI